MKRIISALLIILTAAFIAWAQQPTEIVKVVASTTVPELLGTNLLARTWIFSGCKAARTNNTGRVWICRNPTNDSAGIPLAAGATVTIILPYSEIQWWIDVETAGDGVTCLLIP